MTFGKKAARAFVRVAFFAACIIGGLQFKAVAQTDNLMIVKYVDWDSGSGVAVVLWNPTTLPVNLANYQIRIFGNGSTTPTTTTNLKGTLAPCGTILVGNDEYATSNCRNSVNAANFDPFSPGVNGNDVVGLTYTTTPAPLPTLAYQVIDAVGRIGFDPGNNNSQKVGNTNDALFQHKLERAAGNTARYSLTSGAYNPNVTNTANIWPGNSSTSVQGWTVTNPACLANNWSAFASAVIAGPDIILNCKTTNPISLDPIVTAGAIVTWSGGKGTFANASAGTTTYTPGIQDHSKIILRIIAVIGCRQTTDEIVIINGDSTERSTGFTFTPLDPLEYQPVVFTILNKSANQTTGNWDFGDGTVEVGVANPAQHTYKEAGSYQVKLKAFNKYGCEDSFSKTIEVGQVNMDVTIPNIFTPNHDGINDTFKPQLPPTTAYEIRVFNRWGIKIFESSDPAKPWAGENASDGVYFVHIKATYYNGEKLDVKLPVTILY